MRFRLELLSGEQDGHKGQQPEQGVVTDLFEQGDSWCPLRAFESLRSASFGLISTGVWRLSMQNRLAGRRRAATARTDESAPELTAACGLRAASLRAQQRSAFGGCDKVTRRANHQKSVNPLLRKYSAFVVGQISAKNFPVSPDKRGVAHVTNARWDAVDAMRALDERVCGVRRRRVVLTSRCWRQRTWRQQLPRAQRRQKSRSPGRARYKP